VVERWARAGIASAHVSAMRNGWVRAQLAVRRRWRELGASLWHRAGPDAVGLRGRRAERIAELHAQGVIWCLRLKPKN